MKKKINKQKTQYLTLIQTNRIAHMGMNVTISLANDCHDANSDQKWQKMYPRPYLHIEGVTFRVGELWAARSYGKHLPIVLPRRVTEFSVFSVRQSGIQCQFTHFLLL